MAGNGESYGVGQQVEKIARRTFQIDFQGGLVQCFHPHTIWFRHQARTKSPGPLDVVQQAGKGHPKSWIQHPFPGILIVPRRHRSAVAPEQILPQMKDVLAPALENLPTLGHIGHNFQVQSLLHQPAKEFIDLCARSRILGHRRVERCRIGRVEPQGMRRRQQVFLLHIPSPLP